MHVAKILFGFDYLITLNAADFIKFIAIVIDKGNN